MKTKCPYQFPHKSRAGMTAYLADHESYGGWNHPFRRWSPLSWNVKLGGFSNDGKRGEFKANPEFDDAWDSYVQSSNSVWDWITEDMCRTYSDSEYTTYPGDDQGQWKFCFAGRSGGHMILESWQIARPQRDGKPDGLSLKVDFLRQFDRDSWVEWLGEIEFSTLRALYRAVRCMDQDFTRDKLNREFEHQLNFRREQWEGEHAEELAQEQAVAGFEPCPAI